MLSKESKVTWKWGRGKAKGTVIESFSSTITINIKGSSIKRKGTPQNPANLIDKDNGNQVLKLESQLEGK